MRYGSQERSLCEGDISAESVYGKRGAIHLEIWGKMVSDKRKFQTKTKTLRRLCVPQGRAKEPVWPENVRQKITRDDVKTYPRFRQRRPKRKRFKLQVQESDQCDFWLL